MKRSTYETGMASYDKRGSEQATKSRIYQASEPKIFDT